MSIITLNTRSLPDSAVTTAKIAADAITDAKIADDAVVAANLADNAVSLSASSVTGTLPVGNGGTGLTSGTTNQFLKFTGSTTLASADDNKGKILQVVDAGASYAKTHSGNTTYQDVESSSGTVWETAITPSATSSKILILPSLHSASYHNGGSFAKMYQKIRGKIGSGSYADLRECELGGYDYGGSGMASHYVNVLPYVWSPNTTSECKVAFQFRAQDTSSTVVISYTGMTSKLQLLEIGA